MVKVKLHDSIGKAIGENWNLNISSISECLHAINCLTHDALYRYLHLHGLESFQIIVNGQILENNIDGNINDPNILAKVKDSIYNIKFGTLKTIDIVPVFQLADSELFGIIIGVLLIVVGVVLVATGVGGFFGAAAIIGGIGILAASVINLLSKPPKFEDFREIQNGGKTSYLFNGPENTIHEGGPVPIGYGRLIIGSQVVSASYAVEYFAGNSGLIVIPDGLIRAYSFGSNDYNYFIGLNYPTPSTSHPGPNEVTMPGIQSYSLDGNYIITSSNISTFTPIYKSGIFRRSYNMTMLVDLGSNYSKTNIQIILHFCEVQTTRSYKIKLSRTLNGVNIDQYLTTTGTITANSTDANTTFDIYTMGGSVLFVNVDILYSGFQFDDNGRFLLTFQNLLGTGKEPIINGMQIFESDVTIYK